MVVKMNEIMTMHMFCKLWSILHMYKLIVLLFLNSQKLTPAHSVERMENEKDKNLTKEIDFTVTDSFWKCLRTDAGVSCRYWKDLFVTLMGFSEHLVDVYSAPN